VTPSNRRANAKSAIAALADAHIHDGGDAPVEIPGRCACRAPARQESPRLAVVMILTTSCLMNTQSPALLRLSAGSDLGLSFPR
jgi:hypothetical protein